MFDFDGTLIDTGPDIVTAVNEFLELNGLPPLPQATVLKFIGRGLADLLRGIIPPEEQSRLNPKTVEKEFLEVYDRHVLNSPRPLADAAEFLRSCPYKIAIVSNKREQFIPKILKHLGLLDLPWVALIGGDTFKNKKPHPEPMLAAMAMAGVSASHAFMVGDGYPDVEGALACGIPCVAVEFGYVSADNLVARGAQYRIRYFSDLHSILSQK